MLVLFYDIEQGVELMLGDNIRKVRKSKKISINTLSKNTGISLGYLSDLENNKAKNPTIDKLEVIATALGTTPKELLSVEDKLGITFHTIDEIADMARKALQYNPNDNNSIEDNNDKLNIRRIVDEFRGIEFTETECDEIRNYIKYVISKRN
jgi:transcriptional regulator with XRE-family HTH domain